MSDDAAIRKAFDVWDKNKDGYISKTEVAEVLAAAGVGAGNIASLTEDVMSKTDLNKDDRISFEANSL
ncbi:hypothetical protein Pelo_19517 [Pelomyxa schiedti]|nr:hypothetical protein Pelo_19517 [Pelomyxa schiedti]